jgi:hypothetical protein
MIDSDGFQRIGDLWAYAQLSEGGQGTSLSTCSATRGVSDSLRPDKGVLCRRPEDRWMNAGRRASAETKII